MADRFIRSGDGDDGDNGTTWALANATVVGSIADSSAGETHYLSDNHSESTGASIALSHKGTFTAPDRFYCVDDAGDPSSPSTLATTAVVATGNGAYNITFSNNAYWYGTRFRCGVGATATNSAILVGNNSCVQEFEQCAFEVATTSNSTSSRIVIGGDTTANDGALVTWDNCTVKFGAAAQLIAVWQTQQFNWIGGGIESGSAGITSIFRPSLGAAFKRPSNILVEGVDLSNAASNANLVDWGTGISAFRYVFRNCKLPSSVVVRTGSLTSPGQRIEVYNCSSSDINYQLYIDDYSGTVIHSTSVYRDGGAGGSSGLYNGATEQSGISWLMAGVSNNEFPTIYLRSPEMVQWVGSTGTKTFTVQICHDGASALTDQEVWLELTYLGTSGVPQSVLGTDRCALLASASAQASSSETWTGDSGTGPNGSTTWHQLQLVVASVTVSEVGYVHARVCLAANKSVYVDPLITVS